MFCKCIHAALPPAFRTGPISTCNMDLLVKADRFVWQYNFTSIIAAVSVDFIHLTTVSFDTGLYAFNVAMNNEVILPLISFVSTGHVFLI